MAKTRAALLTAAMAACLLLVPTAVNASAATSSAGSVTDALDMPVSDSGLRPPDVRSMDVSHDPVAGKLTVGFDLWEPLPDASYRAVEFYAALGSFRNGACTASASPDFSLHMWRSAPNWEYERFDQANLAFRQQTTSAANPLRGTLSASADFKRFVARFEGRPLVGRRIECVDAIRAYAAGGFDEVSPFCLSQSPLVRARRATDAACSAFGAAG